LICSSRGEGGGRRRKKRENRAVVPTINLLENNDVLY
jgi:hypothetical protein